MIKRHIVWNTVKDGTSSSNAASSGATSSVAGPCSRGSLSLATRCRDTGSDADGPFAAPSTLGKRGERPLRSNSDLESCNTRTCRGLESCTICVKC